MRTHRAAWKSHLLLLWGILINDEEVESGEVTLHHEEGIDLMLGNVELSGLEICCAKSFDGAVASFCACIRARIS